MVLELDSIPAQQGHFLFKLLLLFFRGLAALPQSLLLCPGVYQLLLQVGKPLIPTSLLLFQLSLPAQQPALFFFDLQGKKKHRGFEKLWKEWVLEECKKP